MSQVRGENDFIPKNVWFIDIKKAKNKNLLPFWGELNIAGRRA